MIRVQHSVSIGRAMKEVFEASKERVRCLEKVLPHSPPPRVIKDEENILHLERRAMFFGFIPYRWGSKITFSDKEIILEHTSGLLYGSRTMWSFKEEGEETRVTITHYIRVNVPLCPDLFARIVQRFIINKLVHKNLLSLKDELDEKA